MLSVLSEVGNASSVHGPGRKARGHVEDARDAVARLTGASPRGVIFTSGATEANVTALTRRWRQGKGEREFAALVTGATDHPSIVSGGRFPAEKHLTAPVDSNGIVDLEALEKLLKTIEGTALVSVMSVNNETGVVQPTKAIGDVVHAAGGVFHVDAVQAAGRIPVSIEDWDADAISVSAHKLGGPQGVGALVLKSSGLAPMPLLLGGGQENHRRAGTENVAAIAGFGVAAEAAVTHLNEYAGLQDLRTRLERELHQGFAGCVVFGESAQRVANTTCFAVPGVTAETALIACDLNGVAVSSGSACSSGKVGVSHVLTAMGVAEDLARCALRVSFGWKSAASDVTRFLEVWSGIAGRMATSGKGEAA